jgi:hypothetical protein
VAFATGERRETTLRQLDLALGVRFGMPLSPRLRLEASTGAGWVFADANAGARHVSDDAPLLFVGVGAALRVGPGEAIADLRWNDVRLAGETRIDGVALGLALTLGYRIFL